VSYLAFREQFAQALDPRFFTIAYLDSLVASGEVEVFCTKRSAIVIEIKGYPTGAKVVSGVVAAGDMNEIREKLIPQAEAFGKSLGCEYGMIDSKKGWERAMKPHGYKHFSTAIVKEL
jgi:hypothetical protein